MDAGLVDNQTSPLDSVIKRQQLDRYESALAQLSKSEQRLIVARLEFGLTYEEMADQLGKPSWNAVRMDTARASCTLAKS